MSALQGIRVIEMAGLAPAPYAGMLLADFGADVIRIDRSPTTGAGPETTRDTLARGKRSVGINMKDPRGVETLLKLIEGADVLLEPFRPGVMEKLGVGPAEALARNPRLVFARLTGWGQNGPYAPMAGHDINYIAISGALSTFGRAGEPPVPPVNLVGDFAGGGMLCAFGILAALLERNRSGKGQVVDAAMVDGAASLTTFLYGYQKAGLWSLERGENLLDTGAPFYDCYETKDGKYLALGAIEPQFYAKLIDGLGLDADALPHQMERERWPELREAITGAIRSRTRDQWCEVFDGTDACVAPVLDLEEAKTHPHNTERSLFCDEFAAGLPAPAPRLSRTPGTVTSRAPLPGTHSVEVFTELGLSEDEIAELTAAGVLG